MFSECCASWLSGEDGRLKRAAVQAFGFIAEQEAPQFGKRIRPQIPQLTAILNVHSVKVILPPWKYFPTRNSGLQDLVFVLTLQLLSVYFRDLPFVKLHTALMRFPVKRM